MKDGGINVVNNQEIDNISVGTLYYYRDMSNFHSKVLMKPQKRLPDMSFSQTNAWMNGT